MFLTDRHLKKIHNSAFNVPIFKFAAVAMQFENGSAPIAVTSSAPHFLLIRSVHAGLPRSDTVPLGINRAETKEEAGVVWGKHAAQAEQRDRPDEGRREPGLRSSTSSASAGGKLPDSCFSHIR